MGVHEPTSIEGVVIQDNLHLSLQVTATYSWLRINYAILSFE